MFSSIDHGGRYAFGNQPDIALWNLARFAEALLPLLGEEAEQAAAEATRVLEGFAPRYRRHLLEGQRAKLGVRAGPGASDEGDAALATDWLALLHRDRVDFTLAWRHLADAAAGDQAPLHGLFADAAALEAWLVRWRERCAREDEGAADGNAADGSAANAGAMNGGATKGRAAPAAARRAERMRGVNPWVIPRNHRVEEALAAASDQGDLGPFERLLAALRRPYEESADNLRYAEPAPAELTACYQTFCGT